MTLRTNISRDTQVDYEYKLNVIECSGKGGARAREVYIYVSVV